MTFGWDMSARAAKSGVRAARKAASRLLGVGGDRVKNMVDASGRGADHSLDAIEAAVIRALSAIAQRGHAYERNARDGVYAAGSRVFPVRRSPRIGITLLGVGVGVMLSLLFMPPATKGPTRRRSV